MKLDPSALVGKTIFVGIDVHKATYSIACVCDDVVILTVGSMPADPVQLIEFLRNRFPQSTVKTVYEAGFAGFVLHRALVDAGFDNIVVHPAAIEIAANNRVKTDKRDAKKMALHLSRRMLRGIDIPTVEQELRRQLTRTRAQLVKERTRIGIQIKSKLMLFGALKPDDKRVMSAKLLAEFRELKLADELAVVVAALADIWEKVQEQVKHLDLEIARQAAADRDLEDLYRSAPGVGPLTARTFANELGDMSRFTNERQLFCFLGLTPSEFSSGESQRRGHITRQGSGLLRGLLVEAAWRAIRSDDELKAIYERLKLRRGGRRAIVAVARRLVGRIRSCLKNNGPYELCRNQEKAA